MLRRLPQLVLLGALAVPSTAAAADYHVAKTGAGLTCSAAAPCATITTAVNKAVDGDTIHVAAGTYAETVDTGMRLSFIGAGGGPDKEGAFDAASTTFVVPPPTPEGQPALVLRGGGSVRAMRLKGDDYSTSQPAGGDGLRLQPAAGAAPVAYDVQDVVAFGGANIVTGAGIRVTGVDAPSRLVNVAIAGGALASKNPTLDVWGAGVQVDVRDTRISGRALTDGGATVTYEGVDVDGTIDVRRGRTTVLRSTIVDDLVGVSVAGDAGTARLVLRDSVVRAARPAGSMLDYGALMVYAPTNPTGESNVVVRNSTIVASGPLRAAMVVQRGSTGAGVADVDVANTVLRREGADGTTTADVVTRTDNALTPATFHMRNSSYSTLLAKGAPSDAPAPGAGGNLAGDPRLAADLTLLGDSPLIDRGTADVLVAGETDRAGVARALDGNGDCAAVPDVGAYERAAVACTPAPAPAPPGSQPGGPAPVVTPAVGVAKDARAPRLSKLKLAKGKLTLTLDEPATLTIVVDRAQGKKYKNVRRLKRSAPKAGKRVIGLGKLTPGRYRVKVIAVDAAGNTTRRTVGTLRVRR